MRSVVLWNVSGGDGADGGVDATPAAGGASATGTTPGGNGGAASSSPQPGADGGSNNGSGGGGAAGVIYVRAHESMLEGAASPALALDPL